MILHGCSYRDYGPGRRYQRCETAWSFCRLGPPSQLRGPVPGTARPRGTVRSWPLLVLAAPAAAEVREVVCLAVAISEEMNLPLSGYVNVVLVSAGCQGEFPLM